MKWHLAGFTHGSSAAWVTDPVEPSKPVWLESRAQWAARFSSRSWLGKPSTPLTTQDYRAQTFSPRPTFSLTGEDSSLSQGARVLVLASDI